jgi:hypothetical protein
MRLVNDVVVHWECQYEQERREKVSFLFFLFIFRLRSHVICLFHPFLFWPPACLFSLRQTDLVIWTVIVVV